jgi:hypothetical protein
MQLPRRADIWLPGYLRSVLDARRERAQRRGPTDILFCVADHYEPLHGNASVAVGQRRVDAWRTRFPRLFAGFVDADGRSPQHTFFFPIEQYSPQYLEALTELCAAGFGEVEVHLHHDADQSENLRRKLLGFIRTLSSRHRLLSRDRLGRIAYGFIHGNWALDNSLPDGRLCGVNDEITVLRETGCYADFTLPAAPSPAQTRMVNRIYYAVDDPVAPRSHDVGRRVAVGGRPGDDAFLLVQGPLALTWNRAKWGLIPRLDNASLHAVNPPTLNRLVDWISCGISVAGRPEWVFVKVHTHGALEANAEMLLGPPMERFHQQMLDAFNDGDRYRLHYVTPREMVNIVHAAEAGATGTPGLLRDYLYPPPESRRDRSLSVRA